MERSGTLVPAANTMITISPRRSRVRCARRSICVASAASPANVSIVRPSRARDSLNSDRRSSRRAEAMTRAPSRANRTAVSRPIPLEAPTTRTTWFSIVTGILSTMPFHCECRRLRNGLHPALFPAKHLRRECRTNHKYDDQPRSVANVRRPCLAFPDSQREQSAEPRPYSGLASINKCLSNFTSSVATGP